MCSDKYAIFQFTELCSSKDRDLLKSSMSFANFRRLIYITDFFEFTDAWAYIWNNFADKFLGEIEFLNENLEVVEEDIGEISEADKWIIEFCHNVPDERLRKKTIDLAIEMYKEKQIEVPLELLSNATK